MMFLEQVLPKTQPVRAGAGKKLLQAVRAGLVLLQKGFYRQLVHYRYQHWGRDLCCYFNLYYNRDMKDLPCRLKNKYLAIQQT